MRRKVAIRADGGKAMGLGHIMRTLPIAQSLRTRGCDVLYICSNDEPLSLLQERGLECLVVDDGYGRFKTSEDVVRLFVENEQLDFVFVDSFEANNDYFKMISKNCLVGTMGYRRRFSSSLDLIVSYLDSTDMRWYESQFDKNKTRVLLGSSYVPLRCEFRHREEQPLVQCARSLFLSVGGADEGNLTGLLLKTLLADSFWKNADIHVVIGMSFRHASDLKRCFSGHSRVCLHENVQDMASLMSKCELAITAAGYTVFELAACRVPMVAFSLSEDQAENGKAEGIMVWVGDLRRFDGDGYDVAAIKNMVSRARSLASDACSRQKMIEEMHRRHIDGAGSDRIADEILCLIEKGRCNDGDF